MQDDIKVYLKDVYEEKNRHYQHIIKTSQWFYALLLIITVISFIGIWLMYHNNIFTDSLNSWVDVLIFFFSLSFIISSFLMISIHKDPKVSLSLDDELDVTTKYQHTITLLKDQTDKLHRYSTGVIVSSIICIFSLFLIMLFIL